MIFGSFMKIRSVLGLIPEYPVYMVIFQVILLWINSNLILCNNIEKYPHPPKPPSLLFLDDTVCNVTIATYRTFSVELRGKNLTPEAVGDHPSRFYIYDIVISKWMKIRLSAMKNTTVLLMTDYRYISGWSV